MFQPSIEGVSGFRLCTVLSTNCRCMWITNCVILSRSKSRNRWRRRRELRIAVTIIAVIFLSVGAVWAEECAKYTERVNITFPAPNQAYHAVCVLNGGPLKIEFYQKERLVHRTTYKTLTIPVDVKPLLLQGKRGSIFRAILVQCNGGSASHIYVLKINPRRHRVEKLVYGFEKGGVDYGFDSQHRLTGMRFHYMRWHIDGNFPGHVFTAIDYKWIPSKQAFHIGHVHVDNEAEAKASLIDLLSAIGSDFYLPVAYSTDEKSNARTYYYRPVGILRAKTPATLRKAAKVKVTVKLEGENRNPHIIDMGAVEKKG